MKSKINLIAITIIVMMSCQSPKGEASVSVLEDSDESVLRNFKTVLWPKAYGEQDTTLLNQLLHEDFQLVDDQGDTYGKEDEMSYVSQYGPSYDTFSFEIERLDIFENGTAVISGKGTLIGSDDQGGYTTTYKSSNVLVKIDGKWKAINSHVSGVNEVREETQNVDE